VSALQLPTPTSGSNTYLVSGGKYAPIWMDVNSGRFSPILVLANGFGL